MQPPKISVVTPSYNQGQFIEETILSVIEQDYPNLEYIIIDGGSTDNTLDIIKKYESNLAYWVTEKDSGQSEAINKGFKKATGEIVCWLNSDDVLLPRALQNVYRSFDENQDLDFLNGNTVIIDKDSKIITGLFILKQKKLYARYGICYVNQPAMFWKRSILNVVGFLAEDYHAAMDFEFLVRIFEKNLKIGQTKELLAGFRVHEMQKSTTDSPIWLLTEKPAMHKLYHGRYTQEPSKLFKLVYGFEKLVKGVYLNKWFFTLKWKGKELKELNKDWIRHG